MSAQVSPSELFSWRMWPFEIPLPEADGPWIVLRLGVLAKRANGPDFDTDPEGSVLWQYSNIRFRLGVEIFGFLVGLLAPTLHTNFPRHCALSIISETLLPQAELDGRKLH